MSQAIAIITSSLFIMAACAVVMWARGKIFRVKAYDHFFQKFAAGALVLQGDPAFPQKLANDLVEIAPFVRNRRIADSIASRPVSRSDARPDPEINDLSEKQSIAYLRTCMALLTALSYSSKRFGAKYRERLYDRAHDRQVVVRLAHDLRKQTAADHCAA